MKIGLAGGTAGLPFGLADICAVDGVTAVRIAKQYPHLHGKISRSGVERDRNCLRVRNAGTVHRDFTAGGADCCRISAAGGGGRERNWIGKLEDHVVLAIRAARATFNTGAATNRQRNFK